MELKEIKKEGCCIIFEFTFDTPWDFLNLSEFLLFQDKYQIIEETRNKIKVEVCK